jgi:hypothetical protein
MLSASIIQFCTSGIVLRKSGRHVSVLERHAAGRLPVIRCRLAAAGASAYGPQHHSCRESLIMRPSVPALLLCLLSAVSAANAGSLPPQTASFIATQTIKSGGERLTASVAHVAGRERREINLGGQSVVLIVLPATDRAYVVMPQSNMMMETTAGGADARPDLAGLRRFEAVDEGEEAVGGMPARRYRIKDSDQRGGFDGIVWSTADGIDLRVDGTILEAEGPLQIQIELNGVRRLPVNPALFEPPSGMTRMVMAPLEGRLPDALKDDAARLRQ